MQFSVFISEYVYVMYKMKSTGMITDLEKIYIHLV